MTVVAGSYVKERRSELASFLRSRRERVHARTSRSRARPAPPNTRPAPRGGGAARRRRRHLVHVARAGPSDQRQRAGARRRRAGVRPRARRALAPVPARRRPGHPERRWRRTPATGRARACSTPSNPLAACVYNGSYDLLACNATYAALFPILVAADGHERNALWQIFTMRKCPLRNKETLPHMVATLRGQLRQARRRVRVDAVRRRPV